MKDDFRKLFLIPAVLNHWGTDCEGPKFFRKQYLVEQLEDPPVRRITPRWLHYIGRYRLTVLDQTDASWFVDVGPGDGAYYVTVRPKTEPDEDAQPPKRFDMNAHEQQQARQDLLDQSFIRDSGTRRNGRIVWVVTPEGEAARGDPDWADSGS
jgi:hypothetical protein